MTREPVFVLSPPRGYSTVVLAILAGHPQIYGFPELQLFTSRTVGELLDEASRHPQMPRRAARARLTGICRALSDLHEENQSDAAVNRAGQWLTARRSWTTAELMEYLIALISPKIALEKTPDTILSDDATAACIRAFPKARFIHLTRHPVTSQKSMHEHWASRSWTDVTLQEWCANTWYAGHLRAIGSLSALPEEQWIRLRAEDILRRPYDHLPRVLGWLGLKSDDGIIAGMLRTERWRFASRGESGLLAGADHKFLSAPALREIPEPGPVVFDPAWGLSAQEHERMTALAKYLGY